MTTDKTPTELDAFIETHMPAYWQYGATEQDRLRSLVRAASAKWGSPVVAGEPVAEMVVDRFTTQLKALPASHDVRPYGTHLLCLVPQPTQPQAGAVESAEFGQFLSDVLTAAGLVTHGKQCKALGERLTDMCVKLRHHGIKGGRHGTE